MSHNIELAAGEEVDSKCLKCKSITNHTIIAMDGETIAKVQCNVCQGRHKYRPETPVQKTSKTKTALKTTATGETKTSPATKKTSEAFNQLIQGRNIEEALPYSTTSFLGKDDLVDHPVFGVGIVTCTVPPNKVELTFDSGSRIFICQLSEKPSSPRKHPVKSQKRKRGTKTMLS